MIKQVLLENMEKRAKKMKRFKAALLGNGAVYEVDINSKKSVLYSSGIKNITSWDLNSKNEVVCAVEGLEAEGVRGASKRFRLYL